jgi:glyoxylase I family protein
MPDPITSAAGTPSRRLDHVGLNVADLPAARAWYESAFGYTVDLAVRLDDLQLDIVMLIHPERGDRLELLHRPSSRPGLRADTPPEAVLTQGFGHIAFDVRGVDEAFGRLVALGARPVMTPRPSPEPGVRMAFVADPEGNLLELLDRSGSRA